MHFLEWKGSNFNSNFIEICWPLHDYIICLKECFIFAKYYCTLLFHKRSLEALYWNCVKLLQSELTLLWWIVRSLESQMCNPVLIFLQRHHAIHIMCVPFNSLWPSDTIWWQIHWSILAQVMACGLRAKLAFHQRCSFCGFTWEQFHKKCWSLTCFQEFYFWKHFDIWWQRCGSTLAAQVMAWSGNKPLPELMLTMH